MAETLPEVYLSRRGHTAWTVSGRHTGRTDLPLTDRGDQNAIGLGKRLRGMPFSRVLVSPLGRAPDELREVAFPRGFAMGKVNSGGHLALLGRVVDLRVSAGPATV